MQIQNLKKFRDQIKIRFVYQGPKYGLAYKSKTLKIRRKYRIIIL